MEPNEKGQLRTGPDASKQFLSAYYDKSEDISILKGIARNPEYPTIINMLAGGIARHLEQERGLNDY
jgi:hypothetical protein